MPSILSKFSAVAAGLVALFSQGAYALPDTLAVYYGQGANQMRLSTYCANTNLDIIPIGFVTKFANTGTGGVIETNFANQCNGPPATGTNFVFDCPNLEADIIECQNAGKKILLSIGGGLPPDWYYLTTTAEAQKAADDIWAAFGPEDSNWTYGRPFGSAVVDGFDLDLEQGADKGGDGAIYGEFAQFLRDKFTGGSKNYYLSAAPQCIYPDAQLGPTLIGVAIDFIFVQFYNNPSCRPTNLLSSDPAVVASQKNNFQLWNTLAGNNPAGNTKWFLGVISTPGSPDYVNQHQLVDILEYVQPLSSFGGMMIWEMTTAANDKNVDGTPYYDQVKHNLQGNPDLPTGTTTTTSATATTTGTGLPSPTQNGFPATCTKWAEAKAGIDYCYKFATDNGITLDELKELNPVLQPSNGCDVSFWGGYYYCLGVSSTTTTTTATTTTTSLPSPTQDGFPATCTKWAEAKAGIDYCYKFATDNGITLDELKELNPVLQPSNGCDVSFWGGYYYCLGVSSTTTTTTSTTTSTTSTTTSTTISTTTSTTSSTTSSTTTSTTSSTTSTTSSTTTTTSSTTSSTTTTTTYDYGVIHPSNSTTTTTTTTHSSTTSTYDYGVIYPVNTTTTTTSAYGGSEPYPTDETYPTDEPYPTDKTYPTDDEPYGYEPTGNGHYGTTTTTSCTKNYGAGNPYGSSTTQYYAPLDTSAPVYYVPPTNHSTGYDVPAPEYIATDIDYPTLYPTLTTTPCTKGGKPTSSAVPSPEPEEYPSDAIYPEEYLATATDTKTPCTTSTKEPKPTKIYVPNFTNPEDYNPAPAPGAYENKPEPQPEPQPVHVYQPVTTTEKAGIPSGYSTLVATPHTPAYASEQPTEVKHTTPTTYAPAPPAYTGAASALGVSKVMIAIVAGFLMAMQL